MGLTYVLGKRFSCPGSERKPHGGEQFFVIKRFVKEGRRSGVQRGGTNQWIVISGEDDDACGGRNLPKLGLNLQTVHLWHANINQGNGGAMGLRISQKLLGLAKY